MALPVNLNAVSEELETVGDMTAAYINCKTGELITLTSDDADAGLLDEESLAEAREIQADEAWIELPDQYEINEYAMMENFCMALEDQRSQAELLRAIKGKGAFRRFKDLVAELGVRDEWFAFKSCGLKEVARDFLELHEIPFVDDAP